MSKNLQDIPGHAEKLSHCLHPKVKLRLLNFLESICLDREEDDAGRFLSDIGLPAVFCIFLVFKNGFPQCRLHDSALALCTNWDTMESQEAAARAVSVWYQFSDLCTDWLLSVDPKQLSFVQQSFLSLYSSVFHRHAGKLNQSRELLPDFSVKGIGQKCQCQKGAV